MPQNNVLNHPSFNNAIISAAILVIYEQIKSILRSDGSGPS